MLESAVNTVRGTKLTVSRDGEFSINPCSENRMEEGVSLTIERGDQSTPVRVVFTSAELSEFISALEVFEDI